MTYTRLYDPDEDDKGGDGGSGDSQPTPVTMESEVTLADGTKTTVGALAESHKNIGAITEERDALSADTNTIFSGAATQQQKVEAARRRLKASGTYGDAEIEQYLSKAFEPATAQVKEVDEDDEGDDDEDTDEEYAQVTTEVATQGQRLSAIEEQQHKQMVAILKERLDNTLDYQLDNNEDIGRLIQKTEALARLKHVDPATGLVIEAKVQNAIQSAKVAYRQQLEAATLARLKAKRDRTGQFDPNSFVAESQEAAKEIVSLFQTALVDLDMIGRVPETVSGSDEFSMLEGKKPVPEPKFDENDPKTWDIQKQVTEYAVDTLSRLAAKGTAEESLA